MFDMSFGSPQQRCDGVSRRDFLRVGTLTALGLTLPRLLAAEADEQSTRRQARAKSVILVYLGGGLSHHDSFDLKPEAPEEIRGIYHPIASNVPGTQIGELLPRLAGMMDKVALVRSGAHNNDHHETATNWVLCGRFGSPFGDYPAMGAVVSHQLGFRGPFPAVKLHGHERLTEVRVAGIVLVLEGVPDPIGDLARVAGREATAAL